MKLTPILGEKHNTFTLIDIEPQEKQHNANGVWYKFECECGEVRIHLLTKIRRGIIKSCGCQNTGGKPHDYLCNYCGEKDSTKFTGNYKHTCRECVNKNKAEYTKTHIRALLSSKAAKFKRQKAKSRMMCRSSI